MQYYNPGSLEPCLYKSIYPDILSQNTQKNNYCFANKCQKYFQERCIKTVTKAINISVLNIYRSAVSLP